MNKYRKALVAVAGVVVTGLSVLYGNNPAVQLVITVAVALGVYHVPNSN